MSNKFDFLGPVQIKHLNIRKQGAEDSRVLAVDVKVHAQMVSADLLDCIWTPSEGESCKHVFWAEDGSPKMFGISKLESHAQFDDCCGTILGHYFSIDKVSKFAGGLEKDFCMGITFSFSIVSPSDPLLEALAKMVAEEVNLKIESPQLELPLAEGNGGAL